MKNKKIIRELKTYGIIGKTLCGSVGAVMGFLLGGPIAAIPGVMAGVFSGCVLEKAILGPSK